MARHPIRFLSPGAALRRTLASAALALLATAALSAQAQSYRWMTIAGGHVGDGLPATNAVVADPVGVAIDAQGYTYVAQWHENRIRRISPGGAVIETIAGDGTLGYAGDGGPSALARFKHPKDLVVDAEGNLYVADSGNRRVRMIAPDGTISTVAGNGNHGHGGDGGPATDATMMEPYGLALDAAGNLYISDWSAHVVRKVATDGRISTVAGSGVAGYSGDGGGAASAQLNMPAGMSVDAAGNLYIADFGNHRIRRVTPGGTISTVAGNGQATSAGDGLPATQASIAYPYDVLVAPDGALIVTDSHCYLRRVAGGVITRFAGDGSCEFHGDGGQALQAGIGAVEGLAFDANDNLYFADPELGRIRRVRTGTAIIETVAGYGTFAGDGGPAVDAILSRLRGIAVEPGGSIHVVDALYNRRIRTIDSSQGIIATTAGTGDWNSFNTSGMPAIDSSLFLPNDLAFMHDGTLLVADRGINYVYAIDQTGFMVPFAGNGSSTASGDGGFATDAGMDPNGVAVDAVGNVYIADITNHRVRKVTNGVVTTVAGSGFAGFGGDGGPASAATLNRPTTLTIDADGGLLIADNGNARIRKIGADGKIRTIAGNGGTAAGGDGGPATAASLEAVSGMAVAPDGSLYIATGSALRRVNGEGVIQAIAGFVYGAMGVAFDAEGALLVSTESGRVVRGEPEPRVRADFDGDRRSDVVWRNIATGANTIWLSANSASRQAVTGVTNLAWRIDGIGDFDGDGKSDLFWRNHSNGKNVIWSGGASSRAIAVPAVSTNWEVVAAADFDGDGADDLFWRNTSTGANTVWRSADKARIMATLGVSNLAWKVEGAGDFDSDGRADVLWRNDATGANTIWKGADGRKQQRMTGVVNLSWKIAGVGDFNGDRYADVLWRNAATGSNAIWKAGNSRTTQAVSGVRNLSWTVVGIGDYDADGRSDILWRNTSTGANMIWRSASSTQQQHVAGVSNQRWVVID